MENHTYIIGEIGQNHNGSVQIAKQIIDLAAKPVHDDLFDLSLKGMDAVKLTKRDLNRELSATAMQRPYNSTHSFGRTYGEHRKALELTDAEHFELFKYAKSKGLDFVETLCAPSCLSLLNLFTPDRLKIASRDLTNLPLIEAIAEAGIPVILSTGMSGQRELDEAIECILKFHNRISILHCVSEYPTHPDHVNLRSINFLLKNYQEYTIGYSDHTIGISVPVAAVATGAEIIEKHITIDRRMKGTDQAGSLGADGLRRMVRDIRLLERSFGKEELFMEPSIVATKTKLERSIASVRDLSAGEVLTEQDIHLLSPGDGLRWSERNKLLGKKLKCHIPKDHILFPELLME